MFHTPTRRLTVAILALVGVFAVIPAAYAAWNRCGPPAHSAAQWKKSAKKNGTWAHVIEIVRSNAGMYHFHPVDGDSINSWFNRQVMILPLAHAGTIPNTGCNGMSVGTLGDKSVAARWPLVVALPDNLTNKDVKSHKTKRNNKRIVIKAAFLGQASCVNGTSRADVEQVVGFVHKSKHPRKRKHPKPKPPQQPAPSGSCNGDNTNNGNGSAGNCNTNTCVGQNNCNTTTQPPTPPVPPAKPSIGINIPTINDIPFGSCRPVTITVDSTAAGTITIDPLHGMIGDVDCYTPSSQQSSLSLPVRVGHNAYNTYVWAPSDVNATSDTLTARPVIAGVDADANTVSVSYAISHSPRP